MPYADVEIGGGQLYARQFDDIYFSSDDGAKESEYVFLQGTCLPNQWRYKPQFCIAETGFGSGLNFLVTLNAWIKDPKRSETLDYFSIEGFPLNPKNLIRALSMWPELKTIASELITQYPPISSGCHSLIFEAGRVQLHLIFEDIATALADYHVRPDCWYLDGFAPAKNPDMWQPEVLRRIGNLSKPHTLLATFTAAGDVRRNLMAAGFEVTKRKGFGRKREMLCATKLSAAPPAETTGNYANDYLPWFAPPGRVSDVASAIVIGAGIAGAQMAFHLAQHGVKVIVIDAASTIASGASGIEAGIIAPKLSATPSLEESFYCSAFLYQLRQIKQLQLRGQLVEFEQSGLVQLAHNTAAKTRFEKISNRRDIPAELGQVFNQVEAGGEFNLALKGSVLFCASAGSINPKSLCRALLDHPNIDLRLNTRATEISTCKTQNSIIVNKGDRLTADALILANAHLASDFCNALTLRPVRGQTTRATLANLENLPYAYGYDGTVLSVPGRQAAVIFGASYLRDNASTEKSDADTVSNLKALRENLPELASQLSQIKPGHVGIRASTPDRWPIMGQVPDEAFYQQHYANLAKGKPTKHFRKGKYRDGIFVLSGLGSRGFTSAGYCANLLAHQILGSTPPAPKRQLYALHPARFLIRNLKRRID